MDLIYYKERIKKVEKEFKSFKKRYLKIASIIISALFAAFIVSLIIIIINESEYFYIPLAIGLGSILITALIIYAIYESRINDFYLGSVNTLVSEIVSNETDFDINSEETRKEIIGKLIDNRMISKGDEISIRGGFEFCNDELNGNLYSVRITRSTGESSVTIFDGIIVEINKPTPWNFEMMDSVYHSFAFRVDKEISEKKIKVLMPKDGDYKYSNYAIKLYDEIKEIFGVSHLWLDFSKDMITIGLNIGTKSMTIKNFNEKAIINEVERYTNILKNNKKISDLIDNSNEF